MEGTLRTSRNNVEKGEFYKDEGTDFSREELKKAEEKSFSKWSVWSMVLYELKKYII